MARREKQAPSQETSVEEIRARATGSPQDLEAQLHLGWTLYGKSDFEGARQAFERARSLGPDSVDVFYGLGMVLKALDQKREADQSFGRAAELARAGEAQSIRMQMLRRMAIAHQNFLRTGVWKMEAEGRAR